jgi:hypothetical protein
MLWTSRTQIPKGAATLGQRAGVSYRQAFDRGKAIALANQRNIAALFKAIAAPAVPFPFLCAALTRVAVPPAGIFSKR